MEELSDGSSQTDTPDFPLKLDKVSILKIQLKGKLGVSQWKLFSSGFSIVPFWGPCMPARQLPHEKAPSVFLIPSTSAYFFPKAAGLISQSQHRFDTECTLHIDYSSESLLSAITFDNIFTFLFSNGGTLINLHPQTVTILF